jgi:hypothetical protein
MVLPVKHCGDETRAAVNSKNAAYRAENPERVKAWNESYRRNNPEAFRKSQREYKRRRYNSDQDYRLLCQLKSRLSKAVGRGRGVTALLKMAGCSPAELRQKLAEQFQFGMSWSNRSAWHIDHVFPLCGIDTNDPVQVCAVNNWRNLRPVWAMDNWKKNRHISESAKQLFAQICKDLSTPGACNAVEV